MAHTGTLPNEQTWQRARLTRFVDGQQQSLERRVRIVLQRGTVRVFQPDGTMTAQQQVLDGEVNGRVMQLTVDNGEQWVVEKQGCNCGGG